MNPLDFLPEMILYGFLAFLVGAGVIGFFYLLSKTRPVTDEAVIGACTFHFLVSGRKVRGLVSLARRHVSPNLLATIERGVKEGLVKSPPGGNPDWKLNINDLHAYGIRTGLKRTLILSGKGIEAPGYSQSEPGVHISLQGWTTQRHVYAYEVLVARGTRTSAWDQVYVIEPINIEKLAVDPSVWKSMEGAGDLAANLKVSAEILEKEMAWSRIQEVYEKRFKEAADSLAEEVDARMVARLEEAKRKISEEASGKPFKFNAPSWLLPAAISAVAFGIGCYCGPELIQPSVEWIVEPWQGGISFTLPVLGFYLLLRRWKK